MKNTYSIILLFAVLGLLGLLAIPKVPLRFTTDTGGRMLTMSYSWPNAAPEALERQVTSPLEGVLGTLQGIMHIRSFSGYHSGQVTLELDKKTDVDQVRFEVASLLRRVYRDLPLGVSYPVISPSGADNDNAYEPLLSMQLNGSKGLVELRRYSEEVLKPKMARLDGIRSVEIYGEGDLEWLVQYDPLLLNSLGLPEAMISEAITKSTQQHNLGWVNAAGGLRQRITTAPRKFSMTNFMAVPILEKNGRIVRLGDVATVQKRERPASGFFRINGKNALQVVLTAQAEVNQLKVASEARALLETIQQELPGGMGIRVDYDATERVYENLRSTGTQAAVACLLIVALSALIFRRWSVMLITVLAIAINLLMGALVFYILKINMGLISLTALIPAVGLMAGQVWAMCHHFGKPGNRSVIRSSLGMVLIMSAAFSVIGLLPQQMQEELRGFAMPLIILQILSLPVCYWFVPALMERLAVSVRRPGMVPKLFFEKMDSLYWIILKLMHRFRWQFLVVTVLLFGIPVFQLPQRIDEKEVYARMYNATIGSEWFSEHGRIYLDKGLGGVLRLFVNYVYDKSSYGSDEQTVLYIRAGLPNQSTVEQMDAVLLKMENELNKHQEIDRFVSQVDNGQQGSIVIYFKKPHDERYFPYQLKARAITLSTEMSGIDWDIYGVGQGFNVSIGENSAPTFNISLKGYNYKELESVALKLKEKLLSHPRIQEVDINREPGIYGQKDLFAYKLSTNDYYWGTYGISGSNLYGAIYPFNARPRADLYQLMGDSYEGINIQPATKQAFDLTALRSEPLVLHDSTGLKLGRYASLTKEKMMPRIRKEDQEYLRQVSFDYMGSQNFGRKFLDKTLKDFEQILPMGYSAKVQSFGWWQMETRRQYELIALSLLLIFIIGAVFFESLRQPFTLIAGILLSFTGLFLAFYISDTGFDQGGYASFLLITGVVSFPILQVIGAYNMRRGNTTEDALNAYFQAIRAERVFILYFITGVLASLAALLTGESEQPFWNALATGTIGGVLGSLIVVGLFLPLFLISKSARGVKELEKLRS